MPRSAPIRLSPALGRIAPSPTLAMTQRARDLKAAGRPVIALAAGEPDFPTPEHICAAAIKAITDGHHGYTAVDGVPALKDAMRAKFARDYGLDYSASEVLATTGGKMLVFTAMLATLSPGDEVIIPAPYWVSYPDLVRLAGGTPVIVTGDADLLPTAAAIRAAITPRTRWLILNSPCNPSGTVLPAASLLAIADVLRAAPQVFLLTDDIYQFITYDVPFASLPALAPDLKERTLIVNGASKAYSMTGWRLGFGAGPASLVEAMVTLIGQSTSNVSAITQWAGVAALNGPHDFLAERNQSFRARRDRLVGALNQMPGIRCAVPDGAFYVFPSCAALLGRRYRGTEVTTDTVFCDLLLEAESVALVPGSAFGTAGHFRISYAAPAADLDEAAARLRRFVGEFD